MSLKDLHAAPHRLFFAAGLLSLLSASTWWTLVLLARLTGAAALEPVVPAVFTHGGMGLYLVFTPFMFGFLLTVFPRWQRAEPVPGWQVLLGFRLMVLAVPAVLVGSYLSVGAAVAGWLVFCAAWAVLLGGLLRSWLACDATVSHSRGVVLGLSTGLAGALLHAWALATGDPGAWSMVRALGLWGFLLPVYFTISHRMIPFFTSCVIQGYTVWRPDRLLFGFLVLSLARALLEPVPALRWLPVLGMAAIAGVFALRWRPRVPHGNRLLQVLHIAFAWLVAGLLLQGVQDLGLALEGRPWLGRAPLHALVVGFLGSMLISMVTRVTMGHSGRPLVMGSLAWWAFWAVQLAALLRMVSELWPAAGPWMTMAAALVWLLAMTAWGWRHGRLYFQPRADGRPG